VYAGPALPRVSFDSWALAKEFVHKFARDNGFLLVRRDATYLNRAQLKIKRLALICDRHERHKRRNGGCPFKITLNYHKGLGLVNVTTYKPKHDHGPRDISVPQTLKHVALKHISSYREVTESMCRSVLEIVSVGGSQKHVREMLRSKFSVEFIEPNVLTYVVAVAMQQLRDESQSTRTLLFQLDRCAVIYFFSVKSLTCCMYYFILNAVRSEYVPVFSAESGYFSVRVTA